MKPLSAAERMRRYRARKAGKPVEALARGQRTRAAEIIMAMNGVSRRTAFRRLGGKG
jgi:hypothetical protein